MIAEVDDGVPDGLSGGTIGVLQEGANLPRTSNLLSVPEPIVGVNSIDVVSNEIPKLIHRARFVTAQRAASAVDAEGRHLI
ncbi:hypothetical protein NQ176_g521 [Zarea fungicola]|uniref:Uncharacterized protein n=1 Tax=Zarea fungicola TaxID=93591 RepID=A0ACC1NWH8_9HYPO|nr:hypothetical protein NQ176_g521 [Lecanicillium fungicola]